MSDSNDTKKKLVGVRITDERRQKWKQFVEESDEYHSMAEMMRTGVNKIISEENEDVETIKEKLDWMTNRQLRLIDMAEAHRKENRELIEQLDGAYEIADEIIQIQEQMKDGELED